MTIILLDPAQSDAATVSVVGSESTGLEATNLQSQQLRDAWLAPDPNNAYVIWDQGSAKQVRTCAIAGSPMGVTGGDTVQVRWRLDDTLATIRDTPGSAAADSGLIDFWMETGLDEEGDLGNLVDFGATGHTYRYVRLDVTGLGSIGYFRAGRAAFGVGRRYDGVAQGPTDGWGGQADVLTTAGEAVIPRDVLEYDTRMFQLQALSGDQKADLRRWSKRVGLSTGIFVGTDNGLNRQEDFIYGLIARPVSVQHVTHTQDLWNASLEIRGWS